MFPVKKRRKKPHTKNKGEIRSIQMLCQSCCGIATACWNPPSLELFGESQVKSDLSDGICMYSDKSQRRCVWRCCAISVLLMMCAGAMESLRPVFRALICSSLQRPPVGFEVGMRVEVVDRRNPILVRVASIQEVKEHQVLVHFDGWPEMYDYWVDDDSPDIKPPGWCSRTGGTLQPPFGE